ncbi:hypothetical protein PAPYR_10822 [Paratrimastix pyriformis]|nr:hypothetical protein PAPYR_10822 [Paratrimastix pyriformis]
MGLRDVYMKRIDNLIAYYDSQINSDLPEIRKILNVLGCGPYSRILWLLEQQNDANQLRQFRENREFINLKNTIRSPIDIFIKHARDSMIYQRRIMKAAKYQGRMIFFNEYEPSMGQMLHQIVMMTSLIKTFDEALTYIHIRLEIPTNFSDVPECTTIIKYKGENNYEITRKYKYDRKEIDVNETDTIRGGIQCLFPIAEQYFNRRMFRNDLKKEVIKFSKIVNFRDRFLLAKALLQDHDNDLLYHFWKETHWVNLIKD